MVNLRDVVLIAATVVAVSIVADRCQQAKVSEWEARVEMTQRQHAATVARMAEMVEAAEERSTRAESIADSVREQVPETRERIRTVRVETPPDLEGHPAIVERDEIIDDLVVQRDDALRAFEEQKQAVVILQAGIQEARASADSLSAVLDDRPSAKPWWVPEMSVGPQVGLGTDMRPYSGFGVTLGWKVEI